MFFFKAMSHKSSSELPKCDCPTDLSDCKSSASIALRAVSNKKIAVGTLEIFVGLVKRQQKSVVFSRCLYFSGTSQAYGQKFLKARPLCSLQGSGKLN